MQKVLFILFFIFCQQVNARLFIQVSIINRKGIDKNLTLMSELHTEEEIIGKNPILVMMKNGIVVELEAEYEVTPFIYGPSSNVFVKGRIFDKDREVLEDFYDKPLKIALGDRSLLVHNKGSQRIELKIQPVNR